MKYAVISDVHANPVALAAVLAECERLGVERIVCAGDVVGYGPDPAGAIRILRERNIPTVLGNHDAIVADLRDDDSMSETARSAAARHRAELSAEDIAWLGSLPLVYDGDGFAVAHAGFNHPERMDYTQDKLSAQESFVRREEPLLFIGHTHVEALFAFGIAGDRRYPECLQSEPRDFGLVAGWQYLVNVGSVGYPRVRPYSGFVIFDDAVRIVRFHRVAFDFDGYKQSFAARALPFPDWNGRL